MVKKFDIKVRGIAKYIKNGLIGIYPKEERSEYYTCNWGGLFKSLYIGRLGKFVDKGHEAEFIAQQKRYYRNVVCLGDAGIVFFEEGIKIAVTNKMFNNFNAEPVKGC